MTTASIKTQSVWADSAKMPDFGPLRKNTQADVCVVGAGMAGLTTAYLLTQAGKSVVVLDDGPLAGGMTEVTTAHLTNAIDDRYCEIERIHGEEGARYAAESHTAAINRIELVVKKENIDCDFERLDGYLFLPSGEKEEILDRELAAAHRAGLSDVEKVVYAPIKSFDTGPALKFSDQAQFHPLKYLAALAHAIKRDGGQIYPKTHAERVEGGRPARVTAGGYEVKCDAVVVATNSPINDLVAIHTKQAAFMTYVIGARVPRGSVEKALYWDTGPVSRESRPVPYHYIRLQDLHEEGGKHELLIIGGEDHRTGQAPENEDPHGHLEAWAHERFGMIEQIEFHWGGQVMEPFDGVAFIGRNPLDKDNVFIVTGDSGMGMTHGTIAGMLLTDLIQGRENPWAKLYDPSRKTLRAAGQYIKEAAATTAQYTDWLTPGDVKSVREIPKDSGAILRRGLKKLAVYRDEQGQLHKFSAVCTHLDCVVRWNRVEKTWDCPCHGSRFSKLGEVVNGPANKPLSPVRR
jgi:glycine/D-amino acid oxidase-like deaminating enzyme/nitrite reductase/ring-hydroxylating ferredoxin subunit